MQYKGNLNTGFSIKNLFDWAKDWSSVVQQAKRDKKVLVVVACDKSEVKKIQAVSNSKEESNNFLLGIAFGNLLNKNKFPATIIDIVNLVLESFLKNYKQVKELSTNFDFKSIEGFEKLYNWTKDNIKFVLDKPGTEVVKSPNALLKLGGDSKSFALFVASVLYCHGIRIKFRLVHFGDKNQCHLFVIALLGDKEIIMDPICNGFNRTATGIKEYQDFEIPFQPTNIK